MATGGRPRRGADASGAEPRQPSYLRVLLAWAFTGLLGGHHFLLGRYLHGLLWLTSCGGFGVGWALDLWRLQRFIDDACGIRPAAVRVVDGRQQLVEQRRPEPGWTHRVQHYVAGLVLAFWYSTLAGFACNAWGFWFLAEPAGLCAVVLSVWAVDNCSRTRGSSLKAVAATAACAAVIAFWDEEYSYITTAAQLASFATVRWRDTSADSRDVALTGSQAALVGAVLAALLGSLAVTFMAVWHDHSDGQPSVAELVAAAFRTYGWNAEVRKDGFQFYSHAERMRDFRFGETFESRRDWQRAPPPAVSAFDAAKLLGLRTRPGWRPTAQEVKDAYRALSLQHHPDKVPPSERAAAEAMQIQLNAAREVLIKRMPHE